jgi:hypothetical protein
MQLVVIAMNSNCRIRLSARFVCAAIGFAAGLPLGSLADARAQEERAARSDANWKITIRPKATSPAAVSGVEERQAYVAPHVAPDAAATGPSTARMTYWEAYQAIPFLRSEYEANPSYRHEAAMELMMGALRPTTIIKQNGSAYSRYPDPYRGILGGRGAGGCGCGGRVDVHHYWQTGLIEY